VRQHGRTPSLSEVHLENQETGAEIAAELSLEEGAVQCFADTLRWRLKGRQDWTTVHAPDETEALTFKLPSDGRAPVFEIFRTAFDLTDVPIRVTVTVFPTDWNQSIFLTGDVTEPQKGSSGHTVSRPRSLDTGESFLLGRPLF
jgi:hypothetical protein